MKGECALYRTEGQLMHSHIIPKFAFDYMKKTGSNYLRAYDNPNKRLQDGLKEYLLSEKAESEFSKRERWFANEIFFPYLRKEKDTFNYSPDLSYFATSLLWRVLVQQLSHSEIKDNSNLQFLNNVAEEWRLFLAEYKFPYSYNDINLLLTDRVTSHTSTRRNVDTYFTRVIDATIVVNNDYSVVAVYAKFLRFIFWSVVKGNPNDCQDLKILFSDGTLKIPQRLNDEFIIGFFDGRIKGIDDRISPSEKEQEKIQIEIDRLENDFWNTDAARSMANDYKMKTDK